MPHKQTPDGSGLETSPCKQRCFGDGSNFYCGIGCRNIKFLSHEKKAQVDSLETQLYFSSNLSLREEIKGLILAIFD